MMSAAEQQQGPVGWFWGRSEQRLELQLVGTMFLHSVCFPPLPLSPTSPFTWVFPLAEKSAVCLSICFSFGLSLSHTHIYTFSHIFKFISPHTHLSPLLLSYTLSLLCILSRTHSLTPASTLPTHTCSSTLFPSLTHPPLHTLRHTLTHSLTLSSVLTCSHEHTPSCTITVDTHMYSLIHSFTDTFPRTLTLL